MEIFLHLGYPGLAMFAFLAATIVPVSSEIVVAAVLMMHMEPMAVLLWASIGNCLGTLFNYGLGYWGGTVWLEKKTNISKTKAWQFARRYGQWSLLVSWLPVVGDPITIAGGVLRWDLTRFIVIVFVLRVLRYYAILYVLPLN